jgi:hypothetical protein
MKVRPFTSIKSLLAVGFAVLIALSSSLVNPVVATHTKLGLPSDSVIMEVVNGAQSYFDINISSVPAGYDVTNGTYHGWCVDRTTDLTRSPAIHEVKLYSTFNPPGELSQQNWTSVNYILNHKQGSALDIQEAIWYFVNFGGPPSPTWPTSVALAIVNDTLANGSGFVPRPTQTISIICFPMVILPNDTNVQVTVIELTVPSLIGDVTGPDGHPDGKVNMSDIAFIAPHFGEKVPPAPQILDLNQDGKINMCDIALAVIHLGDQSL